MPFKSAKQRRAMYAASKGNSNIGISQEAARRFIAHSTRKRSGKGQKHSSKSR